MIRFLLAALIVFAPAAFSADAAKEQSKDPDWVKLDVPYVPTHPKVIDAMLKIADVKANDVLYDLGSGDGRIVVAAILDRGVQRAVGIDLNPKRISEATALAKRGGASVHATFIQGDIFKVDFSEATVVTMYLFDNVNLRLRPRILNELKPGTRVVSHQFHMFDWRPDNQVMVNDKIPVYLWIVPAKVQGGWQGKAGDDAVTLDIKQHMQDVTGEISLAGAKLALANAKLSGDKLVFDAAGAGTQMTFAGKVTPEAITGALIVDGARRALDVRRTP